MSSRYVPLLDGIKTVLSTIAPARVVTREYRDFAQRAQADLEKGIYTILPGPIGPFPYEVSDGQMDSDSLRATENGRVRITVVGQRLLPENASGEDIDAADFEMLAELEQLADDAIEIDELMALKLLHARPSAQAEAPYAWIHTEWEVFPLA